MYLGEAKFYETSLKSLRLRKLLDKSTLSTLVLSFLALLGLT